MQIYTLNPYFKTFIKLFYFIYISLIFIFTFICKSHSFIITFEMSKRKGKMETYLQHIKTGHDSDCAVHNEPAYPNGLCDCGLIPNPTDTIREYIKITGPHIHEGERDGLVSAFQAGFSFKSFISNDVDFLLEIFKNEILPEYYDAEGNFYKSIKVSCERMGVMRLLILHLVEHIKQTDNRDLVL